MEPVRCLIAGIKQSILAEIVECVALRQIKTEIVGKVPQRDNIVELTKFHDASVVVLGMEEQEMPEIFRNLLDTKIPNTTIGIINDGRHVCVCANDIGPEQLAMMINHFTSV